MGPLEAPYHSVQGSNPGAGVLCLGPLEHGIRVEAPEGRYQGRQRARGHQENRKLKDHVYHMILHCTILFYIKLYHAIL